MEEITIKELNVDYYKKELETAVKELHSQGEEIKALENEIDDQNQLIRELQAEIDRISHEDEVVITTKHKIKDLTIYFEEGRK